MKRNLTRFITRAAVIAALYVVLSLAFAATSFSTAAIQFRPSEVLNILPLFFPEAIIGLYIGCLISNIISGSIIDIFFGSLATLIAAALVYLVGRLVKNTPLKLTLAVIPPIVVNAIMVPMSFTIFLGVPEIYWIEALNVLIGESGVVILLGVPLYFALRPLEKHLARRNKPKEVISSPGDKT